MVTEVARSLCFALLQERAGSAECMSCPDDGMHTDPGATSLLDCECPTGTFAFSPGDNSTSAAVQNSTGAVEQCRECGSVLQLCDEPHQPVPKPSGPGIWIDPGDGSAYTCEPYIACIHHTTVEGVLSAACSEGYDVRMKAPVCTEGDVLCFAFLRRCFSFCALQGKACGMCAVSYYRDDDTMCKKCNDYVWIIYTLGFIAALFFAPMIMNVSKSKGFMSINIFVGTMQVHSHAMHLPPCPPLCVGNRRF